MVANEAQAQMLDVGHRLLYQQADVLVVPLVDNPATIALTDD